MYQIYPRSFYDSNADGIGDIPGITAKLGYLQDLGVNAVWLSPFYPSPMADFGYDVADYCDVDPIFGTLADMDKLLAEAHKRQIRIIVDLVPNHTSSEHPWFEQSRQSREDRYSDWYIWRDPKGYDKRGKPLPPNNWPGLFDGKPAWEWEPLRQQFYLHTFDVGQPDLNWANPDVREAIKDAMRFWLDRGVDGFRVDAVPFLGKNPLLPNEPRNPHYKPGHDNGYNRVQHVNNQGWPQLYAYLSEMAAVLKEPQYAGSDRFMVTEGYPREGEVIEQYLAYYEGMDPEVAAPFIFEGLSAPWSAAAWHKFLTNFHGALDTYDPLCVPSYAFGNHDQSRLASRLGDAASSAAVLLLSLPGMAFIYNGEEIGMTNVRIPPQLVQDPGAAGGEGRDPERTPLQWSDGVNAGFSTAKHTWLPVSKNYQTVNVQTELAQSDSYLTLYKRLCRLRNSSAALRYGAIHVLDSSNPDVLIFERQYDRERCITFVNFSRQVQTVHVPAGVSLSGLLVSSDPASTHTNAVKTIRLAPHEAAIFSA